MIDSLHRLATGIARRVSRGINVDDYVSEANEALATVLPRLDFSRPEKEVRHYVSIAVKRACLRLRRAERTRLNRFNVGGPLGEVECAAASPEAIPERVVAGLPSSESRCVGMALLETGRGVRGVAKRLGIGYGTAQRLVKRVKSEIGKVLEDMC